MVLLKRFFAPGANISLTKITAQRGDFATPKDEPVTLVAHQSGRTTERATLWIEGEGGELQRMAVKATSDGVFQFEVPLVRRDFRYRFRAGDGQTQWHRVRALARPRLTAVSMKIMPPKYTQLPVIVQNTLPRQCSAIAGSRFELTLQADRPLSGAYLAFHRGERMPMEAAEAGRQFATTLRETVHFELQLVGKDGLENENRPRLSIHVYQDLPPELELTGRETEDGIYDGTETIAVPFEVKDDFGIAKAELLLSVTKPGEEPEPVRTMPIDLGDQQNATHVQAEGEIDLSRLNLLGDAQVSYAVRVTDNRGSDASLTTNIEPNHGQGAVLRQRRELPPGVEQAPGGEQPSAGEQGPGGEQPSAGEQQAPSQGEEASSQGGEAPGERGQASSQGGEAPGERGQASSQGGEAPGERGQASSQGEQTPGQRGEASGQVGQEGEQASVGPTLGGQPPGQGGPQPQPSSQTAAASGTLRVHNHLPGGT